MEASGIDFTMIAISEPPPSLVQRLFVTIIITITTTRTSCAQPDNIIIITIIITITITRAGRPQPDNREGNESCLAVLNNFYNDGVR